jgi:hypothetical protein
MRTKLFLAAALVMVCLLTGQARADTLIVGGSSGTGTVGPGTAGKIAGFTSATTIGDTSANFDASGNLQVGGVKLLKTSDVATDNSTANNHIKKDASGNIVNDTSPNTTGGVIVAGTLTNTKLCIFTTGVGVVCNTDSAAAANDPSMNYTGAAAHNLPAWNATTKQYDPSGAISITSLIVAADTSSNTYHGSAMTLTGAIAASNIGTAAASPSGNFAASNAATTVNGKTCTLGSACANVNDVSMNYTAAAAHYVPAWNATTKQYDPSGTLSIGITGDTASVGACYAADKTLGSCASANAAIVATSFAGSLASSTGLPISTGVSGLGTGVATALALAVNANGSVTVSCASTPVDVSKNTTIATAGVLCPNAEFVNAGWDEVADSSPMYLPTATAGLSGLFFNTHTVNKKVGFYSASGASDMYIVDPSGNIVGPYKNVWFDQAVAGQSVGMWTQPYGNTTAVYRWYFKVIAMTVSRTFTGY